VVQSTAGDDDSHIEGNSLVNIAMRKNGFPMNSAFGTAAIPGHTGDLRSPKYSDLSLKRFTNTNSHTKNIVIV